MPITGSAILTLNPGQPGRFCIEHMTFYLFKAVSPANDGLTANGLPSEAIP